MNDFELKLPKPKIEAKFISTLNNADIEELCDATEDAILVDGGFGWINPPQRKKLVDYWKGVLLVPERVLIVGKIDNVICGSIQLIKPSRSNEAQAHLCNLTTFFIASSIFSFETMTSPSYLSNFLFSSLRATSFLFAMSFKISCTAACVL